MLTRQLQFEVTLHNVCPITEKDENRYFPGSKYGHKMKQTGKCTIAQKGNNIHRNIENSKSVKCVGCNEKCKLVTAFPNGMVSYISQLIMLIKQSGELSLQVLIQNIKGVTALPHKFCIYNFCRCI